MTSNGFVMENDSTGYTGVFVNKAKIVEAKSISGVDIFNNGNPVDCGIEFTLDIGKDFQPNLRIFGNFKIDESTGKVSAGSATKVKIALSRLGVKWERLGPNNEIPDDVLAQCVGKEIWRLQFPTGINPETNKTRYRDYQEIYLTSVSDGKEKLVAKYEKDVAAGFVKPMEDANTNFPLESSTQPQDNVI